MRRVLVVLALALGTALALPVASHAVVSCSFSDGTVTASTNKDEDGVIFRRSGASIEVQATSAFGFGPDVLVPCAGGTPTITNTDRIILNEAATVEFGTAIVDLRGGPLAPGATAEADGTSEIEVELNMFGPFSAAEIRGTAGDDQLEFGTIASGQPAATLNGAFEAVPDADVMFGRVEIVGGSGRAGRDRISGDGGGGLTGPLVREDFGASGGGGRDVLIGGERSNFIGGGPGRDRLVGSGSFDFLLPGGGRDVVFARGGPDFVIADRGGRDRIDCGTGRDIALLGRADRDKGCDRTPQGEKEIEEAFEGIFDEGPSPSAQRALRVGWPRATLQRRP